MIELWLEVTNGPATGDRLDVEDELTVGRAQPGPAGLAGDRQLSRRHARFRRAAGGQLIVEDLGSINSTLVDGERIERPAVLSPGDTLQLGATTLVVRGGRPPAAGPGPPSGAPAVEVPPRSQPPGTHSGAPAADMSPRSQLPRPLVAVGAVLVLVIAGLIVALLAGGGSSGGVVRNSTVVEPLFPVTNLSIGKQQVASFQTTSRGTTPTATIDWGDGSAPASGIVGGAQAGGNGTYTRPVSGSHTYTRVATYQVTVRVTEGGEVDRASNLAVVTNCLCVAKLPTLSRSMDLGPVSGRVLIKLPGAATSVPLTTPRAIPVGTQLDATRGSLVVMAATAVAGKLAAALLEGGLFQLLQSGGLGGLVDVKMSTPSTANCVAGNPSRVLALLNARVHGSFRTDGRYSAATARGTEWTTAEQCDGTLTRVQEGVVAVQNLRTGQTTSVSPGQTYVASK